MKIDERHIPHIETALGIKLQQHQINYLLDKGSLASGRATGKTLAHCIKLSLSDGKPLDLNLIHQFSDYGDGTRRYTHNTYKSLFLEVRDWLKEYGFKVRDIR